MATFEEAKKEYQELLQKISDPDLISNWEKFQELSQKKNYLEKIIDKQKGIEEIKNRIKENQLIITAKEEPELVALAEGELAQLIENQKVLEKELKNLLQREGNRVSPGEGGAVIVEIRAGAGGEEAALFVTTLFRMYSKYAKTQGWNQKVLDSHPTELGGFKEIVFELKNGDVFSRMKYEGGVHRVQRIPETEKSGRIHTSTASVAILPEPRTTEIKIRPDEIRLNFYRASGPGGQYVNKRETAVRITHLATGVVVTSQTERNQLQNKENALAILAAKLLEKKQIEEEERMAGKRKAQIGRAKRAEKIRTYNFPQGRVTDHRINKSWHNIERIIDGELGSLVNALQKVNNLF